ncbi:hypothetical protein FBU30_004171 [Linnemannia zychae]|nr:hypothetical protein FBU30_004171 [Linnemannia zychae]
MTEMNNDPSLSRAHPNDNSSPSITLNSPTPHDPVLSPPNQPRRSLSAQLAPDYHDWVSDVSTNKPLPTSSSQSQTKAPSSTTSSRFMDAVDAVTGRSKSQQQREQARARRANQPSFSGSAFASDNEENDGDEEDQVDKQQGLMQEHHNDFYRNNDNDPGTPGTGNSSNVETITPTPRLPPLSKSRVNVPDPTRPTYKLGAPLTPKPRAPSTNSVNNNKPTHEPSSPVMAAAHPSDYDRHRSLDETSALLGKNGSRSSPTRNGQYQWTNEGSRRRTPRYDGSMSNISRQNIDDLSIDPDEPSETDSLRRPSRARSLSPNMESRRGRVIFGKYPSVNRRNTASSANRALKSLRRSSIANINLVKEKLLTRRSGYYDDVKEALVKENNGIRIWYHNYTTIDWIHDFVKERVRLRHLRSIGGLRGMLKNRADSLKGWVLVLLTDGSCPEWVSWSQTLSSDKVILGLSRDTFDWIVYCCFGVLFAGICVVMVTSNGTVSIQKSHGTSKSRYSSNSSGNLPRSSSRTSMEAVLESSQPKKIAYFGAGSGIPEVKTILGGFVIRGFLGFRTLMIKLIGLPLMVAAGLNMGKQGPLVHIACCVANIVCRIFDKYNRNDGKRREILSAAAASGVAVAFGAPIGGVLFSLEEVSYYFPSKTMWRSYFCALISAVVLKMINPYRVGKTVLFQVTYDRDWHLFEAIPFFFISVFGGVYGALFSQFHMNYSRFRSRTWIGRHPVQEVLVVAFLTCAIQWLNPWTRVNLLQLLTNLYSECTPENNLNGMCATDITQIYPIFLLLAEVFVMKVFLNFITFGVKVPGGIFIPTMVAGAVFGRMVGLGVQWLIVKYPEHQMFAVCENDSMDCIIPGLYAMIGAAACLSGVTRMTVSLVVIMFELTGAMTYSLPIMMAVMIGKFVGDAFSPDAFFNKLIDLNEHPYLDNKKDYNTFGTAADIADRYLETIDVNAVNDVESLRRKVEILAASGYSDGGLPIVDHGILVGYIASNELGHALDLAEQKNPNCICIFRNRASSNAPATEIITSFSGLEAQNGVVGSPIQIDEPSPEYTAYREPIRMPTDTSLEWSQSSDRSGVNYDNDMQGYNRPIRDSRYGAVDSHRNKLLLSDNKSYLSNISHPSSGRGYEISVADDDAGPLYTDGSRQSHNRRISSTGTSVLFHNPSRTMDFTPFTDQAPLSVSLFSSMDLVMELFIKLGIKWR